jgi:hypothetical protein
MPLLQSVSLEELPSLVNGPLVLHLRSRSDPADDRIRGDPAQETKDVPDDGRDLGHTLTPLEQLSPVFDSPASRASSEDTFISAQSSPPRYSTPPTSPSGSGTPPLVVKEPRIVVLAQLPYKPTPLRRQRPARRFFGANSATAAKKRQSYPDRFIPDRLPSTASERPIQVTKHPSQLRHDEKFTRQRSPTANPFAPRRADSAQQSTVPSTLNNRLSSLHHPTIVNEQFVLGSTPDPFVQRSPSTGAFWNVGGSISISIGPITAVPNGHGGYLGSGTNAPIYDADFLSEIISGPSNQIDEHEARLALALDIDQASRILPHPSFTSPDGKIHSRSNKKRRCPAPIEWKDNAWKNDGKSPCE